MPRCVVCDHCSEIDGGYRSYHLIKKSKTLGEYICEPCDKEIISDLEDYFIGDEKSSVSPGFDDVEFFEVLGETGLAKGPRRIEE